jgi:heme exporter protein A
VLVRLVDVSKRYGGRWALARVSLELDRPAVVLLTGENGAGKTTLLKVIATLQRPTSGEVELFGLRAADNLKSIRRHLGLITHQAHLYFDLSARENLLLVARLLGKDTGAVDRLLERVGLGERKDQLVRTMSAGMKRRVGVAKLLLQQPRIALLDEPFTQLDPGGVEVVEEVVRELRAAGALILLATHDTERGKALAEAHLTLSSGIAESLRKVAA